MASIPSPYVVMRGYAYLLASKKGGTLYCGVTSDLPHRWWEHREGITGGFTHRAIKREKAIKSWPRAWKDVLTVSPSRV